MDCLELRMLFAGQLKLHPVWKTLKTATTKCADLRFILTLWAYCLSSPA